MNDKIRELKQKLQKIRTTELLGMIGTKFIGFGNDGEDMVEGTNIFNKTNLMSPQKQYTYLAGLLMSTEDVSDEKIEVDFECFEKLEEDIQDITFEYSENFFDFSGAVDNLDKDRMGKNLVAMQAFTSYFDIGILRYEEQTQDLIKTLYSPFNKELENLTGLVVDDFISFYKFMFEEFSNSLSSPQDKLKDIERFLSTLSTNPDTIESEYEKVLSFAEGKVCKDFANDISNLNTVSIENINWHFGDTKGQMLIDIFSLKRKERNFSYYNRDNPFSKRPLCLIDGGQRVFIVHPQFLLNAIYEFITETLENPQNSFIDKYTKLKAEIVENLFLCRLNDIFGSKAKYHVSVCEEKGTKEHDILVEYGEYIIIAEVKASKVREPFFNPEKSFVRIKDHFNSDRGIGGAYNQAITLKRLIENNESITLYENKTDSFVINNISNKVILPFILTLNQFGSISINTSPLLNKENSQPYPWVCNLHDLENIIEINKYLKKDSDEFIKYIIWRIENHERIISSDELDVIEGYYLQDGVSKSNDENIFFWPIGPSLIDKIYFEKHDIPYSLPSLDNKTYKRSKKKVGRNELCPCGSGKKYKKCCID